MAEDLTPGAEGLVTGHDQAGALVASGDQHEHQVRGLGIKRDVSSGAKGRRSESWRARLRTLASCRSAWRSAHAAISRTLSRTA